MSRIVGLLVSYLSFTEFRCRVGFCALSLSLSFLWIPGSGDSGPGLSSLHCFDCLPCSDAVDVTC
jgi:hypothetical protein